MPKKTKNRPKILPTLVYLTISIVAWIVVWLSTQALFITDIPVLTKLLATDDTTTTFLIYSLWIMALGGIVTIVWSKWSGNDYSFLKTNKKQWVILGYLPVAIAAIIVIASRQLFGIPGWLWAPAVLATTFFQDILTFGYLQTALARRINPIVAALLTAIVFFAGHFWLVGNVATMQNIWLYLVAFPIFALLRYKTKNIYAIHIIHSAFYMFSAFL
jgi:membrane protease YdiL (CAAX protease family)